MEILKKRSQTRACDVYDLHEDKALAYAWLSCFTVIADNEIK